MPNLVLRQVSFARGKNFALQGIDLTIPVGSFLAVLGPNGSGKTTLLQLMSGLLVPKNGEVLLGERPLASLNRQEAARHIALISSDQSFDFPFSVNEVVSMGRFPYLGRLGGMRQRDTDIVQEAMTKTEVDHLGDRAISQLSSGERQMVLIARALAQTPTILLLDEPNVHLDIQHQLRIFQLLSELNHQLSMSVVVVLHDLTAAATFFREVALLSGGKLFQAGPPDRVITEQNIRQVYQTDVTVQPNPLTGTPQIIYAGWTSDPRPTPPEN